MDWGGGEARCLGGGGDGEGELRDSRETEERGIADDSNDDGGQRVEGVGQRVKPSVSHLQGFRHLPIAVCLVASTIISCRSWPLLTISTSMSSSSSLHIWNNTICFISLSSARIFSPQRYPYCIGPSATTLPNRRSPHLGSVWSEPLSSRCRER